MTKIKVKEPSVNYSSKHAEFINEEKFGPYSFPFKTTLSFGPIISFWKSKIGSADRGEDVLGREIMNRLEQTPYFFKPIEDFAVLDANDDLVELLLAGMFPSVMRDRQLAFAIPPFFMKAFYFTPKLYELLKSRDIRFGFGANPVLTKAVSIARACALILNKYYNQKIIIDPPFTFIMNTQKENLEQYYISQLNSDFVEIKKLKPLKKISQDQINKLLNNIYDTKSWLEMIPPENFEFEGLVYANLINVTEEESLSRLKHKLLDDDALLQDVDELQNIARNYFDIPELKLGVKAFDFPVLREANVRYRIDHHFLINSEHDPLDPEFNNSIYQRLCIENTLIVVEDLIKYPDPTTIEVELLNMGFRSLVAAPLNDDAGNIIGFLELGAKEPNQLNALTLIKIAEVIPLFEIAVKRSREEIKNKIQALIRENYTHIHPSVEWKFIRTSYEYLEKLEEGQKPLVKPIVFKDVYAMYGQADVVSSSSYRNNAIRHDYLENLKMVKEIFKKSELLIDFPLINHFLFELENHINKLKRFITSSDEMKIYQFFHSEVHPIFEQIKVKHPTLQEMIDSYFKALDPQIGIIYSERRAYEESIVMINDLISRILEVEDNRAQAMIPHYFEKYKTDGLEFDIYIGQSILQGQTFSDIHLKNMRLWQLTTLCEITRRIDKLKAKLPCPMDTAQLIMVYPHPINIRFRTDEKRFDVDGAHNLDYEIIKKRVDKARVENSNERLRKAGHIVIIFAQENDKFEYKEYIRYLAKRGFLYDEFEELPVEKLQGVEGLKSLRVRVKTGDLTKTDDIKLKGK